VKTLAYRYDQMSRGLLGIYPANASSFGIQYMNPIRLYDKWDFFGECFMASSGLLAITVTSIVGLSKLSKDSIFSVYTREKQPYRVIQELKKLPSSMSGLDLEELANNKQENKWSDPITYEEIPEDEIRSPRIFRIEKHAYDVKGLLMWVFARPLENNKIWYPYSNGYMTAEVQRKFVQDISAFFGISEEKFLDCWKLDITLDKVPGDIPLNDLFILARTIKFLELIPNEAIRKNLAAILLRNQRQIVAQLSLNPMSLTYVETLGHPSFSVQNYLEIGD
jgi:hypothetical protein